MKAERDSEKDDLFHGQISMSQDLYKRLMEISDETGRTVAWLLKMGAALVNAAATAKKDGHELAIVDAKGKVIRRIGIVL
jgi:hypothetical protein